MEDINRFRQDEKSRENKPQKLKCLYCEKMLSSRQNLREHSYVHTGEMPYLCKEYGCGESFRQGSQLSVHKKIHLEVEKQLRILNEEMLAPFPKLTKLLEQSSQKELCRFEDQQLMKAVIGDDLFNFIEKYL